MAGNLLLLARLAARPDWEEMFARLSGLLASKAAAAPASFTQYLAAVELGRELFFEVVIAGRRGAADTDALIDALRRARIPWKTVLLRPDGPEAAPLLEVAPFLEPYRPLDGRAAAYVCAGLRCFAPVTTPEDLIALLE